MLVHVRTSIPVDPVLGLALEVISSGLKVAAKAVLPTGQPARGLYIIHHFSFDHICDTPILEKYPEFPDLAVKMHHPYGDEEGGAEPLPPYGVCDSPAQFMAMAGDYLKNSPRAFAVAFTEVTRASQPPDGGWRWHKWGPYIGACKPSTEYLYDERFIDRVFVYHVYEFNLADIPEEYR